MDIKCEIKEETFDEIEDSKYENPVSTKKLDPFNDMEEGSSIVNPVSGNEDSQIIVKAGIDIKDEPLDMFVQNPVINPQSSEWEEFKMDVKEEILTNDFIKEEELFEPELESEQEKPRIEVNKNLDENEMKNQGNKKGLKRSVDTSQTNDKATAQQGDGVTAH